MKDPYADIYSFIKTQESTYKQDIVLPGRWMWGMQSHIEKAFLYLHSQLTQGKDDWTPVKNIIRAITNLQHRTEDIELAKDVELYVDDPEKYHLSFLVRKYHEDVYARENNIDTFLDELNVSRIDYGGGLSKRVKGGAEVVPLHSIAFCDQRDLESAPIGLKHNYSPDQLLEKADVGWGDPANGATGTLDEVVELARNSMREEQNDVENTTAIKNIEVYEVHGILPKRFLYADDDSGTFIRQFRIETFYKNKDGDEYNITLFAAEEQESPFKLIKRDPVYGRALGFGAVEELEDAQVWTTYGMIRKQKMLDAAAVTVMITQDPELAARHPGGLKDLENMEFLEEAPNGNTRQLDTFPRNMALFDKADEEWQAHAQQIGAANDSIMGDNPTAGTPFKLQELVTQESHGLHEYRRGQYAKHVVELYNDWFIPDMLKAIAGGTTFLSELSLEDLQYVTECVVTSEANKRIKEMVLAGETPTQDEIEVFKNLIRDEMKKKGNKHFIEILKGEFKNTPIAVKVDVLGKSKNLSTKVDKITNLWRFMTANPMGFMQIIQIPGMGKSFNELLEDAGLSPADFSGIDKYLEKMQTAPQGAPGAPQQALPPGGPQPAPPVPVAA